MIVIDDCPFCSCDKDFLTIERDKTIGSVWHWVLCENCLAQGPKKKSKGEALEAWCDR